MGLVLRGAFVWEISWLDYRNMMHGHSHVAMLGWVYLALYGLIGYLVIPAEKWNRPIYSRLFWFTQFCVVGMMVSFPLQGYGAVSITFSALHILASYLFVYLVWRDQQAKHPEITLSIKTASVFMVVSTIGVWSLGPLTLSGGRSSTLYQLAIQFYLHFQFHGWFTFVVLALVMHVITKNSLMNKNIFRKFYFLLVASVVLTYGLVLAWGMGGSIPLLINGLGLVLQLMALFLFFMLVRAINGGLFQIFSPSAKAFYQFGLVSWLVKVAIQSIVLLPAAAVVSFTIRSFMIGFIHLTMLGFISGLLFALLLGSMGVMMDNRRTYAASTVFISGFVLTELLLFGQGLFYWFQWGQLPAFYELIFGASVLLPLSILMFIIEWIRQLKLKTINHAKANLTSYP